MGYPCVCYMEELSTPEWSALGPWSAGVSAGCSEGVAAGRQTHPHWTQAWVGSALRGDGDATSACSIHRVGLRTQLKCPSVLGVVCVLVMGWLAAHAASAVGRVGPEQ